ncbi:hypothetical protein KM043_007160 [Ampulex compressa]|nr:hypothetical protein KM043_007160 [Ampulex compressa]
MDVSRLQSVQRRMSIVLEDEGTAVPSKTEAIYGSTPSSATGILAEASHPLPPPLFSKLYVPRVRVLIRSTWLGLTPRNSIPRSNSDLIKRHAHGPVRHSELGGFPSLHGRKHGRN